LRFFVRVHNDAVTSDGFRLRSSTRHPARVTYHHRGADITNRLRSAAGFVLDIPAGRQRSITMDLTFGGPCPYPQPRRTYALLTAQRVGHPLKLDRVQAGIEFFW
ncbi:MAG: hypothetical protein ACXWDM_12790, partial [Nocardioides sp.]